MPVRNDYTIMARDGDGCLFVQIDAQDPRHTRFTIEWAHAPGTPPNVSLKEVATFILGRGREFTPTFTPEQVSKLVKP